MSNTTALRLAGLAAVTLVAVVIALALTRGGNGKENASTDLPPPAGLWYKALAAPYLPSKKPRKGVCGVLIKAKTMGVAHPVLPCGVKIYVEYGGKQVLTQVIDRGPDVPGRDFDLTRALAATLGLTGTKTIHWRYAK
jgi:hypothetical protein